MKKIFVILSILIFSVSAEARWIKIGIGSIAGNYSETERSHLTSTEYEVYFFNKFLSDPLFKQIKINNSDALIYVYYVWLNSFSHQENFPTKTITSPVRYSDSRSHSDGSLLSHLKDDDSDPDDYFLYYADGYRVSHNYGGSCNEIGSRSDWIANHGMYSVGDTVKHRREGFRCITQHTAAADKEPAVGANWTAYWKIDQTQYYWLDFGNPNVQDYVKEAITTDFLGQPFMTEVDGLYSDHAFCLPVGAMQSMKDCKNDGDQNKSPYAFEAAYNTDTKFAAAMNSFTNEICKHIHSLGWLCASNRGHLNSDDYAYTAWSNQDAMSDPLDIQIQERGFVTGEGKGDMEFLLPNFWVQMVNTMRDLQNSAMMVMNDSKEIAVGKSGFDQYGIGVTFWEGFYFTIASFALGMHQDRDFLTFDRDKNYASVGDSDTWFTEFDAMDGGNLDLGPAKGTYRTTVVDSQTIYYREFERGYVYVNPQNGDATGIALPENCILITHDNHLFPLDTITNINSINLSRRRSAILYKVSAIPSPKEEAIECPKNFKVIQS